MQKQRHIAVMARQVTRVAAAFLAFVEPFGSMSDVSYLNATPIKAENKNFDSINKFHAAQFFLRCQQVLS